MRGCRIRVYAGRRVGLEGELLVAQTFRALVLDREGDDVRVELRSLSDADLPEGDGEKTRPRNQPPQSGEIIERDNKMPGGGGR